jgi:protein involved in polysaccharide export with SLBB domain
MVPSLRCFVSGLLAVALIAPCAGAQSSTPAFLHQQFETRRELEAAAEAAESQHRAAEAWLLRTRLQRGDFQEGDRIVLSVDVPALRTSENAPPRVGADNDTVIVRAGKLSQFTKLPNIPDLSLNGVLRSELVDTLTWHLRKYLRDPVVRATPLVRVAVMGAVGRPGWYSTPTDVVLADVIMQAGGVTPESDVDGTVIRRAGEVIWTSSAVRMALADGLSLDRLQLRGGDEIDVAQKRRWSLASTIQLLAAAVGIYAGFRALNPPRT